MEICRWKFMSFPYFVTHVFVAQIFIWTLMNQLTSQSNMKLHYYHRLLNSILKMSSYLTLQLSDQTPCQDNTHLF